MIYAMPRLPRPDSIPANRTYYTPCCREWRVLIPTQDEIERRLAERYCKDCGVSYQARVTGGPR